MLLKKRRIVLVEWEDSTSVHRWQARSEVDNKPAFCRTVGWLVAKDKKAMTVVGTYSAGSHFTGDLCIPMGAVRKVTEVKEP